GSTTLHQGSSSLHQGSTTLHQGSSSLHQGSTTLHQGSSSLQQGSTTLHQGSSSLHQGSSSLHQGSSVPEFIPALVRPFPKAPPRKEVAKPRKKIISAILTDTPAVAEEEVRKSKKTAPKNGSLGVKKRSKSSNSVDCLVCGEEFTSSAPGEKWVKCVFCDGWSHELCTEGNGHYVCHVCDEE
ncbi:hypothetical protein ABG768_021985, partial [Culter alburnus]